MTFKKNRKSRSRSKVMPVFAFFTVRSSDKLSKSGQISCVIPYYIEIKNSLYLGKYFVNLLENWYKNNKDYSLTLQF